MKKLLLISIALCGLVMPFMAAQAACFGGNCSRGNFVNYYSYGNSGGAYIVNGQNMGTAANPYAPGTYTANGQTLGTGYGGYGYGSPYTPLSNFSYQTTPLPNGKYATSSTQQVGNFMTSFSGVDANGKPYFYTCMAATGCK